MPYLTTWLKGSPKVFVIRKAVLVDLQLRFVGDFMDQKGLRAKRHRLLLTRLKFLGLCDAVVRWIEVHLTGRVSRVQVGGELSGAVSIRSGVPQSSVICPILFGNFVSDLPDALESPTLLFPDCVNLVTHRSQSISLH